MDRYELCRMARDAGVNVGAKTIENLEAFASLVAQSEREACATCVPTTWLDPMLTGPEAVVGNLGAHNVEAVLKAVKARIMDRSNVLVQGRCAAFWRSVPCNVGLGLFGLHASHIRGDGYSDEENAREHFADRQQTRNPVNWHYVAIAQRRNGDTAEVKGLNEAIEVILLTHLEEATNWQEVVKQGEIERKTKVASHCHDDALTHL